jgi:hypothetical protein
MKNFFESAVNTYCVELAQYSPCLHVLNNQRICGIAKSTHTTGHYGEETGEHEGPPPPPNVQEIIQQRIKDLDAIVISFIYFMSNSIFFALKLITIIWIFI